MESGTHFSLPDLTGILGSLGDLATIILGIFVYQIMTNHLPHLQRSFDKLNTGLTALEARVEDHLRIANDIIAKGYNKGRDGNSGNS